MLNELRELSVCLGKAGINPPDYHSKFTLCPKRTVCSVYLDKDGNISGISLMAIDQVKRKEIILTDVLKAQVCEISEAVHKMIVEKLIPSPVNDKRCDDCSLREACMPHVSGNAEKNRRAAKELFEFGGEERGDG